MVGYDLHRRKLAMTWPAEGGQTGKETDMTASTEQSYDRAEVVRIAHERGLKHITEHSVVTAAYRGSKPLKRTKLNGRIYFKHSDVEAWLAGERIDG